ncbi:hypothetical protein ANO11243_031000 [Dothideomycetidae sp. 11243]|nr:hypothetical protein ANO11243_031000 [fungal sp. No.11243]
MATDQDIAVWASFIYLRAGDSTPSALQNVEAQLTTLGANQLQAVGQFFRNLYLEDGSASRIASLDASQPQPYQVSAITLAEQTMSASAQAFMLGVWPPNSTATQSPTDVTNALANGSVLSNPLGGLRFPLISVVSENDIESIFVGGDISCNGFTTYAAQINPAANLVEVELESRAIYNAVQYMLDPVFSESQQTFDNAKNIFDYVNYQNIHNKTAAAQLANQPGVLASIRHYADLQQIALYGDLNAGNPYDRAPMAAKYGSISTIAGGSLASQIGSAFFAQSYAVRSSYPLSVTVGDYGPLTSIFSLLNLTTRSSDFLGTALPGSAAVFELISPSSTTSRTENGIPEPEDLSVRFRFRNGTGIDGSSNTTGAGNLVTFPLFNQDASETSMPYIDFLTAMGGIAIASPHDWCYQCGAQSLFCAAYNGSDAYYNVSQAASHSTAYSGPLSAGAAGAIGALTTLLLSALIALAAFFLLGLRLRRTEPIWASHRRRRHDLGGGFKGSAKLASDPDLTRPFTPVRNADGAIIGASVEKSTGTTTTTSVSSPHARTGSWELTPTSPGGGSLRAPQPALDRSNAFSFACAGVGGQKRHVRDSTAPSFVDRDFGGLGGLDGAKMGWGSREDLSRRSRLGSVADGGAKL